MHAVWRCCCVQFACGLALQRYGPRGATLPPPSVTPACRYAHLPPDSLPLSECLKDTVARFMPAWTDEIAPSIRANERVLIAAHGNSLRALVKHLDGIADDAIAELNIPTGIPLVYTLDDNLVPIRDAQAWAPLSAR